MRDLETSFVELTQSLFGLVQSSKNMRPIETSLFLTSSRILCWSMEVIYFSVPGDHLKHRFLDITKVDFWASQDAENNF